MEHDELNDTEISYYIDAGHFISDLYKNRSAVGDYSRRSSVMIAVMIHAKIRTKIEDASSNNKAGNLASGQVTDHQLLHEIKKLTTNYS